MFAMVHTDFCISRISLWKTSHRSAKIAPNAYPDTSTEASGRCLDISPSNLGRSRQKMSGIGLGVMIYMYFGPEIGLCALLYKMAVQILVTKTTEILLPPLARGQANLHPPLAKGQAKLCQVLTNTHGLVGSLNGLEGSPPQMIW